MVMMLVGLIGFFFFVYFDMMYVMYYMLMGWVVIGIVVVMEYFGYCMCCKIMSIDI